MAGLTKNIRRTAVGFAIGGVAVLLAIPTTENGKPTLALTPGGAGAPDVAALAAGVTAKPVLVEFEDGGTNVCSFTDNVKLGNNSYPEPVIGFKLGGRSNELNKVIADLIFTRHSFLLKLKTGECIAVGVQNGLKATQANSGGDGTPDGFSGYDLVLTGGETQLSPSITPASFAALVELVPED